MISFLTSNPLLTMALLVALAGVAALTLALPLLALGGQVFLRAYEGYYRRKSEQRRPLWPSLSEGAPGALAGVLRWAGWKGRIPRLRHLALAAAGAIAFVAATSGLAAALVLCVAFGAAVYGVNLWAKKRIAAFVAQLPDGLTGLADALRSGFSLPQALDFLSREVHPPLRDVCAALVRAEELRLPPRAALSRLRDQLGVPEWTVIAEALIAQEHLGGNIIPLLEETARALRDRLNVEREIITLTAAGRMSGLIIAGLVPVVLVFFILVSPDYMRLMFTTGTGRLLFLIAMTLEVVGFVWIRRVTRIEY